MALNANLQMLPNRVAQITLTGELDAGSASLFKATIEQAAAKEPTRVVLKCSELKFMASAGLRVLIFAKQKMGPKTELHIVGAQPAVLNTITMTGFDRSVVIADESKAAS